MKKSPVKKVILFMLVAIQTVCGPRFKDKEQVLYEVEHTRNIFAPDKRTAIFDLVALKGPSRITLVGESNLPRAMDTLQV